MTNGMDISTDPNMAIMAGMAGSTLRKMHAMKPPCAGRLCGVVWLERCRI